MRGRTVLVTGASSGIGRATARLLASRGANVVLVARSAQSLAEAEQECRSAAATGADTLVVTADVADADSVDAALEAAVERFGRVDAVVHSAAVLAYGRFEDVPADVFDTALSVTLGGTVNTTRSALRHFRARGGGSLVVVGSLLGKIATPYMSSYVTAKWAVHGLVRTVQIETRSEPGIDVSLVSPGGVNTPVYRQAGTYLGWHGRPPPPVDPPERVARAVVAAVERPRRETSVGLANPLAVLGFRALPGVYDLLVTPLMRLGGISRDEAPASAGNVLEPQPSGNAVHGAWGRHWLRPVGVGAGALASGAAWLSQRAVRR
jgi:NAD(P)-dependent dehydrogenase (short-subunit alcohol dehydrogenase family)